MQTDNIPCIRGTRREAPAWAELEWKLIARMEEAVELFRKRYVRDDGTLVWRTFWPGMDGSDDAFEAFQNYPLLYALGADKRLMDLANLEWDTMAWQWTEYGQVYREFFAYYDWMHHGEGSLFLYYMGLADPHSLKFKTRATRFASFYNGEDEEANNYDPQLKMMRAPINGSLGPRFAHTAEDWTTHREQLCWYLPPFEDIPGVPFVMGKSDWADDVNFKSTLDLINKRMAKGDVPLNLNATSMVAHAYMYTGEEKYKTFITDYLGAWEERTKLNGGIIPDNIGPSGKIGECIDGKWWGGYYGWRWPHGAGTVIEPLLIAGLNALLVTGESHWVDIARSQMDLLYEMRKEDAEGKPLVPYRHLDTGWGDFRRENTKWPVYTWSVTMDEGDKARIGRLPDQHLWGAVPEKLAKGNRMDIHPWYHYITGKNPDFPMQTLTANLNAVERRIVEIAEDKKNVAAEDIHHWQDKNPVICEALVQLMLGGSTNIYHGGLMHVPLRYFSGGRPGLPRGVGALVNSVDAGGVDVSFHNTSKNEASFIIQGGCFGEHGIASAEAKGSAANVPVDGKYLQVTLMPGEGVDLRLGLRRFTQKPSYLLPGMTGADLPKPIQKRYSLDVDKYEVYQAIYREQTGGRT